MTTRFSLVAVGALAEARQRLAPLVAPARRLVRTKLEHWPHIRRWEARGAQIEARGHRAAQRFVEDSLDDIFVLLRQSRSTWSFVDDIVRHLIDNRDVRDLVDDIVAFLVHHPLVLAMVRQQTVGFTDEVVQTGRDQLARVDGVVDHLVASVRHRLLHGGRPAPRDPRAAAR